MSKLYRDFFNAQRDEGFFDLNIGEAQARPGIELTPFRLAGREFPD